MARVLPVMLVTLSMAPAALAQNALGDGRALERSTQLYSNQNYSTRSSLSSALQFQNAIVTGNAPGGLSFRGDVGYRAAGEFTGQTGGTQNFNFRRDSFYSGLQGQGIRGSEALQLQFNLMTGSNTPTNLQGSLVTSRPGTGAYAANFADARAANLYAGRGYRPTVPNADGVGDATLQPLEFDAPDFDPRGRTLMLNNVRSTASMLANDPIRKQIIDTRADDEGNPYDITATTLGGVNLVPLDRSSMTVDRSAPSTEAPESTPLDEKVDPLSPDAFLPEGVRSYESILKDLQNTELPPIEGLPQGIEQPEMVDLPDAGPEVQAWKQRLLELRRSLLLEPGPRPDDDAETSALDPVTIDMLKSTGGTIDVLSPVGIGGVDAYAVNMHYAEELLADGRYFDAEEQFARALRVRSGDPMAAVGRVHAEIGAGMYLSAVLNLRALFSNNPELITSRYATGILPKRDRLESVKNDLREKLRSDHGLPRESGLVLAYIGFQTRDQVAVTTGLNIAEEAAADAGDETAARLVDLLRSLWVAKAAPVGRDE